MLQARCHLLKPAVQSTIAAGGIPLMVEKRGRGLPLTILPGRRWRSVDHLHHWHGPSAERPRDRRHVRLAGGPGRRGLGGVMLLSRSATWSIRWRVRLVPAASQRRDHSGRHRADVGRPEVAVNHHRPGDRV